MSRRERGVIIDARHDIHHILPESEAYGTNQLEQDTAKESRTNGT
jgi:hypothetical protein